MAKKKEDGKKEDGAPSMEKLPPMDGKDAVDAAAATAADPKDSAPVKAPTDSSAVAPHDDEEQDRALFAQMMKQYLGDDKEEKEAGAVPAEAPAHEDAGMEAHHEAMMKMAHEAREAYEGMGYSKENAMHAAGHAMRLAKHMAAKEAHKETGGAHDADQGKINKVQPASPPPGTGPAPKDTAAKAESAKPMTLAAENAVLKERLKKHEVNEHLEKTLRESGMPYNMTKTFREALGTPKSTTEIDLAWKMFKEAAKAQIGGEAKIDFPFLESRATQPQTNNKSAVSFSDCLK